MIKYNYSDYDNLFRMTILANDTYKSSIMTKKGFQTIFPIFTEIMGEEAKLMALVSEHDYIMFEIATSKPTHKAMKISHQLRNLIGTELDKKLDLTFETASIRARYEFCSDIAR